MNNLLIISVLAAAVGLAMVLHKSAEEADYGYCFVPCDHYSSL